MRANKSLSPFGIRVYRYYHIVHDTRVTLTFLLTFLIIRLFTAPEGTWLLVTMVVIMGPILLWGNVIPRAFECTGGTVLGPILGLIALQLELILLPPMSVWCAVATFLCGWLALGKKPYQGLLIGVTLTIVVGLPTGETNTALWRSDGVILGSSLAMLFTGIWPQRAFIHWRIQLAKSLTEYSRVYQSAFSPNLLECPRLESHLQKLLTDAVKMCGLIAPASRGTRTPESVYGSIQTINRNLVCMLELQVNAYWAARPSRSVPSNTQKLRGTQRIMQQILLSFVHALYEDNPQSVLANTEKLNDAVEKLRQSLDNHHDPKTVETPIYGYVWLNMETAHQLELLSNLICRASRKQFLGFGIILLLLRFSKDKGYGNEKG